MTQTTTSAGIAQNSLLAEAFSVRPILFSGEMVRAILDGRKTQTRRIIKLRDGSLPDEASISHEIEFDKDGEMCDGKIDKIMDFSKTYPYWQTLKPKYNVGDILWVRETWQYVDFCGEDNGYVYRSTDPDWQTMDEWKWKPSLFMPKQACRLFLKVTDVRVERLHDLTEPDAAAEGCQPAPLPDLGNTWKTYRQGFEYLWAKINGQKSWDENPFVWVVSFERAECPSGFC